MDHIPENIQFPACSPHLFESKIQPLSIMFRDEKEANVVTTIPHSYQIVGIENIAFAFGHLLSINKKMLPMKPIVGQLLSRHALNDCDGIIVMSGEIVYSSTGNINGVA